MEAEYDCVMPFWIDTEAYTDRDRQMFVCGVDFEMIRQAFQSGRPVDRTIHTENESRVRMMAAKLGRQIQMEASGTEGWTFLWTTDNETDALKT